MQLLLSGLDSLLDQTDVFSLSAPNALLHANLKCITEAVLSLRAPLSVKLRAKKQIEILKDNIGKSGRSIVVQVASAVGRTQFYNVPLEEFCDN